MDTIYIETSVVSHVTSRLSSDPRISALQYEAREWWSSQRGKFRLLTSQLVLDEAAAGDVEAASERLRLLDGLPLVRIDEDVRHLARRLLSNSLLPAKAAADALHIAAAAVSGIQYLLTLNCRHIANAHELPRVYRLLDELGYGQLLICTPAEFLGEENNEPSQPHP